MSPQDKIDLYKQHKLDYTAQKKPVLLRIDTATYLTIEGEGEPGGAVFEDKIGALYSLAFTVKMTRKFTGKQDYAICKLEAQWWSKDERADLFSLPPSRWCWRLLIRTPHFVKLKELDRAAEVLLERGKPPSVEEVRLEKLKEGQCVQMLHVGPYDQESRTVAVMKAFAEDQGLSFKGRHHEIYLSDPRRVEPERLKTILRQPVS
jgi:hypothetical protein